MNITFWLLMILMLLLAIALLVYPLLKARQYSPLAYKESNLKINDDKIRELDLDLAEGRIDQQYYKAARDELDRELLVDIPAESTETAALHYTSAARRHPTLALVISVFVPMLAMLTYLQLGMHTASDESFVASQQQAKQPPSVEEMARKLEAQIQKNGGTVEEWTMLARSHKYLGKHELAAKAFAVALEKDTNNAQLMLEMAEMLALNNNSRFTPEARELVLKAYALEPDNANTLWFIGVAEFQQGNYQQAISHLTQLLPLTQGEDEVAKSVITVIAQSREQLIAAGKNMPELNELIGVKPMVDSARVDSARVDSARVDSARVDSEASVAQAAGATQAQAGITSLSVMVDISAEVREKFAAGDAIFVYAKAKQGPRFPLAVQRLTLAALPATVVLDDSMAMMDGMNLSAFDQLVVSARATKSGSAISQSGDYIGSIEVKDKAVSEKLSVVIDTVIP